MKRIIAVILSVVAIVAIHGCKNTQEDTRKKAVDLISVQTLGLAYLEEFKLDDAEKAFLKYIKLAPKAKLGYANLGLTYLRMAKYPEAEQQLLKAIAIDSADADVRLILATVYQMEDQRDKAINQLKEALAFAPDHIKALYDLTELYSADQREEAQQQRLAYTLQLSEKAPGNLVPHLNLTEIYIKKNDGDKATEQLELIRKQFPEFPKEASEYFDKALSLLKRKDYSNAFIQFTIFHNYMKVTSPYQAGIMDLKGPGGSLIGFPLITFDQKSSAIEIDNKSLLEVIRFTDVTASAGLPVIAGKQGNPEKGFAHIEACDYDGDNDIDLYAGSYDPASGAYKHFLFNNEMGRFTDKASETGINTGNAENSASFADYDNDGFIDLLVTGETGNTLWRNADKGSFKNVTQITKTETSVIPGKALFFDLDHDGDLDIYELTPTANLLFRNNGDGTFTEQAEKMGMQCKGLESRDAVFGDFDDDGDIDLFVVNSKGSDILFSNQREGLFRDVTGESGLTTRGGSGAAAAGDFNNDGFLDIMVTSMTDGNHTLYVNKGNGKFEADSKSSRYFASASKVKGYDAAFLDFDNDGYSDILLAGESAEQGGRGLLLYHNDTKGGFTDVSGILPEEIKSGRELTLFDYNEDGDTDVAVAGVNGGFSLLRNDGGNTNHFIKMKLMGLRAGSAKNNHFGIGAKVEMRAGDLYQSMVVTSPEISFGLGSRSKADVIRITWTNGVPQNIFMPGADQSLIEAQTLKGSCPFLYTWDGEKYEFSKDILWRSALGMPLGIMGGTKAYGFADASDDYIKIGSENIRALDGKYNMQITSELWETIYLDKLELVAVDHPSETDIFVPEQFSPPPFPGMKLYHIKEKYLPATATDQDGNDLLDLISGKDDNYISGFKPDRYQGITEMHDLVLDPGKAGKAKNLYLFLNGWIFPTDASINSALAQSDALPVISPVIEVRGKHGEWVALSERPGFPMGKNKTVVFDLSGKFITSDHRIRIRTNMEIYWDYIFFANELVTGQLSTTVLKPSGADLHYRGFSAEYRKGGRYGPHWFDYSATDTITRWRDLTGNYTRYGDVLPLLTESDNKYIISNAGDETTVAFDASQLPELKTGWTRDFMIHSAGWVKDGDLNTATGNTVLPLPFHGMKSYPPADNDLYPATEELKRYNKEYNTRVVTLDRYRNVLKNMVINEK